MEMLTQMELPTHKLLMEMLTQMESPTLML